MIKFAIGQPVTRLEDQALLIGAGRYADDLSFPNAARAVVLRSPHAHARIARIDVSAAARATGVLAVLSGEDVHADKLGDMPCLMAVKNIDGSNRADTPRPILARGFVRHVGDPVALVVAETIDQAKDAAELIDIEYQPLPAAVDTVHAADAGAPAVWPHIAGNVCFNWHKGDLAAVNAAFKTAAHVTRVTVNNNRLVANSLEARSAIADYDPASDRSTLYTPTQGPHMILRQLAENIFKLDKSKFRVVTGHVGGSFGMKIFLYPEQPLVVWASRKLKRAVKWVSDRSEAFLSDNQGRDNVSTAELALDQDGQFLALKVTTYANLGAYLSNAAPFIPTYGTCMLVGVYRTPAIYVNVKGVITNTVPIDAYRGAGRPEAIYVIERAVEVAAREMGLTPDEIRRRNFIRKEQMPYQTALGEVYDSGDFLGAMQGCMDVADWKGFPARRAEAKRRGKLRGIGMGTYIETCGSGDPETAIVRVNPSGRITLTVGAQDNGQGHFTSHVQIMAEILGVDPALFDFVQGDTDVSPAGLTGGSRALPVTGAAVQAASKEVVNKGKQVFANTSEVSLADVEYADGRFRVAGTDVAMTLFQVAGAANDSANLPAGAAPGLDVSFTQKPPAATYPNGCHIIEVEIDPDTGHVEIERYTVVDDFGRTINPLLLAGQVHGGIAQGVGQALLEQTVYDRDSGQLLSGSFMDYALPRADNLPSFAFSTRNEPCTTHPMGIKGAGEAGAIGAPPAVMSAIVDALYPACGATHIDMPATPEKIWRLLQTAQGARDTK